MLWQLMERLNDNPTAMLLVPLAIMGFGGAIPLALESRRRSSIEGALPEMMELISAELGAGLGLEQAFADVAKSRNDVAGSLLDQALVDKAVAMTDTAYAPYSGFLVGAAVQLNNGVVLGGCNQENASYPLCMCGERVALYNAAANYPHQSVVSLAIVARNPRKKLTQPVSPCGACRQVIAEYESRYGSEIRIILKGETDDVIIFDTIKGLLPYGFDGTFL